MPMFLDPDGHSDKVDIKPSSPEMAMMERSVSEESVRTEDCEGPLLDDFEDDRRNQTVVLEVKEKESVETSDRAELIERIKRGESPTWVPNRKLEEYFQTTQQPQQQSLPKRTKNSSPLLPAIELRKKSPSPDNVLHPNPFNGQALSPPSEIERPKSALHAGDFTQCLGPPDTSLDSLSGPPEIREHPLAYGPLGASPTTPWLAPRSSLASVFQDDRRFPRADGFPIESDTRLTRSRAPSIHSFSSSYILKAPTSPLVQQSNNDDLDFSPIELSSSPSKTSRRHTLPPQSLQNLKSFPSAIPAQSQADRHVVPLRREGSFPYQSHHARRSFRSNWTFQQSPTPQAPSFLQSRRPSLASESSPLQHASMVGSYEESILRGRMSTNPSKPLDFTAQIGVLGKGDCKPKCPAHVTIPFPAVYYSWNNGNNNSPIIDDEPSPYVGHIDLEHLLSPVPVKESHRKHIVSHRPDDLNVDTIGHDHCTAVNLALRKREKLKRRSPSPKAPLGGSYRIPQQGQLQIMIKNPNKTAVKLFLVPYNLSGMEPGTKTFIRQRCYSSGPILPQPLTSSPQPATTSTTATSTDPQNKQRLRYLIHLNICSPSKGRFYLHQHIRVVFANRVPDNKENLRNDIQLPEPRYSIYKPVKESPSVTATATAKLALEKTHRRRSYGSSHPLGPPSYDRDLVPAVPPPTRQSFPINTDFSFATTSALIPPVPSVPYSVPPARAATADDDPMDLDPASPLSDKTNRLALTLSSSYRSGSSGSSEGYGKLTKGEAGYGGVFGRPHTPEPGEGLLARRLREGGA